MRLFDLGEAVIDGGDCALGKVPLVEATFKASKTKTCFVSEKVFASQERVSGFPEKGADLRGSPGKFEKSRVRKGGRRQGGPRP